MSILISSMVVHNIILSHFLGLCPFIGVSNHPKNAAGMALATMVVLTLVSLLSFFIFHTVLVPFNLTYLTTLSLIFVIAASVQALEMMIKTISPLLHKTLGLYLPLMTSNCAVLGVGLLVIQQELSSYQQALAFGFGAGAGFAGVLWLLSQLRSSIAMTNVPKPFQGTAIGLLTAAIMSMAFMGFQGL